MKRRKAKRKGKRVFLRQIARPYTSLIFAGKDLGDRLGARIKGEPINVIGYVLRESPTRRIRLLGEPFPRQLKDLNRGIPTTFADDLVAELRWTLAALLHHADPIREFLQTKQHVQDVVLLG